MLPEFVRYAYRIQRALKTGYGLSVMGSNIPAQQSPYFMPVFLWLT